MPPNMSFDAAGLAGLAGLAGSSGALLSMPPNMSPLMKSAGWLLMPPNMSSPAPAVPSRSPAAPMPGFGGFGGRPGSPDCGLAGSGGAFLARSASSASLRACSSAFFLNSSWRSWRMAASICSIPVSITSNCAPLSAGSARR